MRVLYSNASIKYMLKMDERALTKLIDTVKGSVRGSAGIKTIPVKGFNDKRRFVVSGKNYALLHNKKFKGKEIVYVLKIIDEDELEYFNPDM